MYRASMDVHSPITSSRTRAWCLLPLALAPLAWTHARRLRESKSPSELIVLLGDTGKLLALYALLFSAGEIL